MSESACAMPNSLVDHGAMIESLRQVGADKFDPVQFHYLEALAVRVHSQEGSVRSLLQGKLVQALARLRASFEEAQCQAQSAVAGCSPGHPHEVADLQLTCAAGDFAGVGRAIAALREGGKSESLAGLARDLIHSSQGRSDSSTGGHRGLGPELKSVNYFRETWGKISADKRVTQALGQAPKNAGPINSHVVALRSLALMRDIAPDYLNRFISYVDTLLCLDQRDREMQSLAKLGADGGKAKAANKGRVRTR